VKKICYISGDIEFFLGDCFLLAHPVHAWKPRPDIIHRLPANDCRSANRHVLAVGRPLGVADVSTAYRTEHTVERARLNSSSTS